MKAILNDDGEIENQETAAEMNARIIALSQVYFCIISTYFCLGSGTPKLLNLYYFCIYATSSNCVPGQTQIEEQKTAGEEELVKERGNLNVAIIIACSWVFIYSN